MAKIKCAKCGTDTAVLYTRQNQKGVAGIFWCENCTGQAANCRTEADALITAIEGTDDGNSKRSDAAL